MKIKDEGTGQEINKRYEERVNTAVGGVSPDKGGERRKSRPEP